MDLNGDKNQNEAESKQHDKKHERYTHKQVEKYMDKAYANGVEDAKKILYDLLSNRAEVNDGEYVDITRSQVDATFRDLENLT
jgi:hypothetical protein